ncbi:MAG: M61 family metallopeptidase [Bacteriovoracaceae bacterium]
MSSLSNFHYLLEIASVKDSYLDVTFEFDRPEGNIQKVFLPSWSPGSYLMREYARFILWIKAESDTGERLHLTQKTKSEWELNWDKSELQNQNSKKATIKARIYCHELTVRTSYIDHSMAFLHGPTFYFGLSDEKGNLLNAKRNTVEVRFPLDWSKISTGLKDISDKREVFLYEAQDFDELLDAPFLLGCHETDGFRFKDKDHELAFAGMTLPHGKDLKADIKRIVETVSESFDYDLPYDKYSFLTILKPNLYGGLEHLNSTALVFDGRKFKERKSYLKWLELVAHEYFHTWNVKRIRPKALGPFDYQNENYTRMLWLAEGLTSFMDQYFVYRSGLMTMEEYLEAQKNNFNLYLSIPGKKFQSLEESSFNAWVKLYRPSEFNLNSTISYYLKGGIAFFMLHLDLVANGNSSFDLIKELWTSYKENPETGLEAQDVYQMIEKISNSDVVARFQTHVETTEDIDFESALKESGFEVEWDKDESPYSGLKFKTANNSLVVSHVVMDGPGEKAGLMPGDEIVGLNGMRFFANEQKSIEEQIEIGKSYDLLIARNHELMNVQMIYGQAPKRVQKIKVIDESLSKKIFPVL